MTKIGCCSGSTACPSPGLLYSALLYSQEGRTACMSPMVGGRLFVDGPRGSGSALALLKISKKLYLPCYEVNLPAFHRLVLMMQRRCSRSSGTRCTDGMARQAMTATNHVAWASQTGIGLDFQVPMASTSVLYSHAMISVVLHTRYQTQTNGVADAPLLQ